MTPQSINPATPEVALLTERLNKLDDSHFDWAAWKRGTLLVLEKIFGKESIYVNELMRTDYEYSSWSLRDTSGSGDPVKASCKELLQICITDVNNRPDDDAAAAAIAKEVTEVTLRQFLDKESVDNLSAIANAESPEMEKEEQIMALLKKKLPKHQGAMLGKLLLNLLK